MSWLRIFLYSNDRLLPPYYNGGMLFRDEIGALAYRLETDGSIGLTAYERDYLVELIATDLERIKRKLATAQRNAAIRSIHGSRPDSQRQCLAELERAMRTGRYPRDPAFQRLKEALEEGAKPIRSTQIRKVCAPI